ncbi:hypothetical protein C8F04DRAFT_1201859 [Mycena alexandri]|uniref:Uncharacterized protein n=1 Tax=Mycena alexandri TaxID=1745969 RepID=A0AAD6RXA6_9AGAR|nr:hypothetical protein C8F04DRAFT_1201859 [Mycena alexandri]
MSDILPLIDFAEKNLLMYENIIIGISTLCLSKVGRNLAIIHIRARVRLNQFFCGTVKVTRRTAQNVQWTWSVFNFKHLHNAGQATFLLHTFTLATELGWFCGIFQMRLDLGDLPLSTVFAEKRTHSPAANEHIPSTEVFSFKSPGLRAQESPRNLGILNHASLFYLLNILNSREEDRRRDIESTLQSSDDHVQRSKILASTSTDAWDIPSLVVFRSNFNSASEIVRAGVPLHQDGPTLEIQIAPEWIFAMERKERRDDRK